MDWIIKGGRVPAAEGLSPRDVFITNGVLADAPSPGARVFDAAGLVVAPGIVDLHGDGFERNFSPRPGVFFDMETALIETDRQLIANGITTAYLALTISWEPGLRSRENARAFVEALRRVRPHLISDVRLQLRWEVFALDAVDDVSEWLHEDPAPTLAFNDHFSMLFDKASQLKRDFSDYAVRAGLTPEEYAALTDRTKAREGEVAAAIERLAREAAAAGAPMLAHDEMTAEIRRRNRALGISISEFPMSREAAAEAVAHGEATVLGAPNVVRGGSHIGAMDAEPAAREGLCTALASDYFYPSQINAAARMLAAEEAGADATWALVSGNAARAVGLTDRGTLSPGSRADLCLFRQTGSRAHAEAVFKDGALALSSRGL